MEFTLSPEQEALRDSVRRFVEREHGWEATKARSGGGPLLWRGIAELGCLGAGLEEEFGGFGGSAAETAIIAEVFGCGLVTAPFAGHVMAVSLLRASGSETAKSLLGDAVAGERQIVPALLEPDARGDLLRIRSSAAPVEGGFELGGEKILVEAAADADVLLVSALVDAQPAVFLVESAAAGISRRDYRTIDNRRVADLSFERLFVPSEARLALASPIAAIERAVNEAIVVLCAEAVGAMDAALWLTRDYVRTRQQFGVPIGSFQALQHRMADMLIETELARSMLFQALAALAQETTEAQIGGISAAKVQIGEAGLFVGGQAIQLHGGIGMTEEYIVGHYYKRLFAIAHSLGTADHHLERFAAARDHDYLERN